MSDLPSKASLPKQLIADHSVAMETNEIVVIATSSVSNNLAAKTVAIDTTTKTTAAFTTAAPALSHNRLVYSAIPKASVVLPESLQNKFAHYRQLVETIDSSDSGGLSELNMNNENDCTVINIENIADGGGDGGIVDGDGNLGGGVTIGVSPLIWGSTQNTAVSVLDVNSPSPSQSQSQSQPFLFTAQNQDRQNMLSKQLQFKTNLNPSTTLSCAIPTMSLISSSSSSSSPSTMGLPSLPPLSSASSASASSASPFSMAYATHAANTEILPGALDAIVSTDGDDNDIGIVFDMVEPAIPANAANSVKAAKSVNLTDGIGNTCYKVTHPARQSQKSRSQSRRNVNRKSTRIQSAKLRTSNQDAFRNRNFQLLTESDFESDSQQQQQQSQQQNQQPTTGFANAIIDALNNINNNNNIDNNINNNINNAPLLAGPFPPSTQPIAKKHKPPQICIYFKKRNLSQQQTQQEQQQNSGATTTTATAINSSTTHDVDAFIAKLRGCNPPILDFSIKLGGIDCIRILPKSIDTYRNIIHAIKNDNDITYNTYQLQSDRSFRVIVRGIHASTNVQRIKSELSDLGYIVRTIYNPTYRSRIGTGVFSPNLFFIELAPQPATSVLQNRSILKLKTLCNFMVKIEWPKRKVNKLPQCHRCQFFNHTAHYCSHKPRCVKCGAEHQTMSCTKPKNLPAKCANCFGDHTANFRGCPFYLDLLSSAIESEGVNVNLPKQSVVRQAVRRRGRGRRQRQQSQQQQLQLPQQQRQQRQRQQQQSPKPNKNNQKLLKPQQLPNLQQQQQQRQQQQQQQQINNNNNNAQKRKKRSRGNNKKKNITLQNQQQQNNASVPALNIQNASNKIIKNNSAQLLNSVQPNLQQQQSQQGEKNINKNKKQKQKQAHIIEAKLPSSNMNIVGGVKNSGNGGVGGVNAAPLMAMETSPSLNANTALPSPFSVPLDPRKRFVQVQNLELQRQHRLHQQFNGAAPNREQIVELQRQQLEKNFQNSFKSFVKKPKQSNVVVPAVSLPAVMQPQPQRQWQNQQRQQQQQRQLITQNAVAPNDDVASISAKLQITQQQQHHCHQQQQQQTQQQQEQQQHSAMIVEAESELPSPASLLTIPATTITTNDANANGNIQLPALVNLFTMQQKQLTKLLSEFDNIKRVMSGVAWHSNNSTASNSPN